MNEKKETPFETYEVNERGYVVNEKPKTVQEVYDYVVAQLKKHDPEPHEFGWYGIIDEYFSISGEYRGHAEKSWPLDARWIAVFAVTGGSEGHYIHVEAMRNDPDTRELLFLGKTFQGLDHAIECVRQLSNILEV